MSKRRRRLLDISRMMLAKKKEKNRCCGCIRDSGRSGNTASLGPNKQQSSPMSILGLEGGQQEQSLQRKGNLRSRVESAAFPAQQLIVVEQHTKEQRCWRSPKRHRPLRWAHLGQADGGRMKGNVKLWLEVRKAEWKLMKSVFCGSFQSHVMLTGNQSES